MFKFKKGFTLIELLVVISIVSLLSSIVLASLKSARLKARDAERVAEVNQLRKALELYYLTNGSYPASGWTNSASNWSGSTLIADLVTTGFMPSLPTDPINNIVAGGVVLPSTYGYSYFSQNYGGSGDWYMLVYNLEGAHPIEASDGVATCLLANTFHYGNGTTDHRVTLGGNCTKPRT